MVSVKKFLVYCLPMAVLSCSKPVEIVEPQKDLFYKIVEHDNDGTTISSEIKFLNTNNFDGDDHHDDDDDDDDSTHCPVPIKIESISVQWLDKKTVKLTWEATNEYNVNYYEVQRSYDSSNWDSICARSVSGTGYYKVIDIIN